MTRKLLLPKSGIVGPTNKKRGRPPKLELNQDLLRQLHALGGIQATVRECAAVLGCAKSTLAAFFNENERARDEYEDGKLDGLVSLRRKQFAMAEKSCAMAIWLGKQYLGQREPVQQIEQGGPGEFDHMSNEELRAWIARESEALGIGVKIARRVTCNGAGN